MGIGAGAVGFIDNKRYYTKKGLEEYISNPMDYEIEDLSNEDIIVEKVLLGLRCSNGFEKNILDKKQQEKIEDLKKESKIEEIEGKIYNKNFLLADELALYILE